MSTVTDSLAADYRALTEQVGLVDRSERGKLALTGGEAKEFLHGQVTNDIEALEPGRGCYAAFLTHKGKMLGDLRVLDLGDELFLDTERVALQELFNMIRRYKLGRDVELHKRTRRARAAVARRARRARGGRREPRPDEHDNVARRDRRRAGAARRDRRRRRRDLRRRARRRGQGRARACPRSPRRRRRSCASSPAARATASTSTTP